MLTRSTQEELLRLEQRQEGLRAEIEASSNGGGGRAGGRRWREAALRELPKRIRRYVDDLAGLLARGQVERVKGTLEPLLSEVAVAG